MDKLTRSILVQKLGELNVANAELVSENVRLAKQTAAQTKEIGALRARLESKPIGEGAESNGAGLAH
jgi:hypothetical protein